MKKLQNRSKPPALSKSDISEQTITVRVCSEETTIVGTAKAVSIDPKLGTEYELKIGHILYGVIYEKLEKDCFTFKKGKLEMPIYNYRSIQLPCGVFPPGCGKELQVGLLLDDDRCRKLTGYKPLYFKVIYDQKGIIKNLDVPGTPLIVEYKELSNFPVLTHYNSANYILPILSGTWLELTNKIRDIHGLVNIGDSVSTNFNEYWYTD